MTSELSKYLTEELGVFLNVNGKDKIACHVRVLV